jgi:hypothetical protein
MSFWNKTMTERQWNGFWARIFLTLYILAILYTMFHSGWGLLGMALISGGLTWALTASHFYHRSQRDYLFMGQWWAPDQMKRLREGDPDMQSRAVEGDR